MSSTRPETSLSEVILDPGRLDLLRELESGGGEPLIRPLVASYLSRSWTELAALASTIHAGDREAVEGLAHRLRGASSNLGLARVAAALAQLEQAANDAPFDQLSRRVRGLEGELEAARRALLTYLGSDPAGDLAPASRAVAKD